MYIKKYNKMARNWVRETKWFMNPWRSIQLLIHGSHLNKKIRLRGHEKILPPLITIHEKKKIQITIHEKKNYR